MKKNLISVAILVLLIVNIVLTSIMMFSVLNTNKKQQHCHEVAQQSNWN